MKLKIVFFLSLIVISITLRQGDGENMAEDQQNGASEGSENQGGDPGINQQQSPYPQNPAQQDPNQQNQGQDPNQQNSGQQDPYNQNPLYDLNHQNQGQVPYQQNPNQQDPNSESQGQQDPSQQSLNQLDPNKQEQIKNVEETPDMPKDPSTEIKFENNIQQKPPTPSDGAFNRMQDLIKSIAEGMMKSSDILTKRKNSGILPVGYSDRMKKLAQETRDNKNVWNPVMSIPTELYRMCIYPSSKVNYTKWCNNIFAGMQKKTTSIYILIYRLSS